MKKRPAQSHLQNRILLHMEHNEVDSLTGLARELNAHRPSVSRAMHALSDAGFVSKVEGRWVLTPAGEEEVQRVQQQRFERTKEAITSINRVFEQVGTLDAFARIAEQVGASQLDAFTRMAEQAETSQLGAFTRMAEQANRLGAFARIAEQVGASQLDAFTRMAEQANRLDAFARIAEQAEASQLGAFTRMAEQANQLDVFARIAEQAEANQLDVLTRLAEQVGEIESSVVEPTFAEIAARHMLSIIEGEAESVMAGLSFRLAQEALESISQTQRLCLSSIEQISALGKVSFPMVKELGQANIRLSNMIEDLGVISAQDFALGAVSSELSALMPNVAEVTRTYRGHFADVVGDLGKSFTADRIDLKIVVPARTTSAYVSSVRAVTLGDDENLDDFEVLEALRTPSRDWVDQLDDIFRDLGPNFIAKWHGSWEALNSGNPDCICQAAHSGRELLMQIIAELAPDSAFETIEIEQFGSDGKVTRKMRVEKILSGSSASTVKWVDAVAKALDETYDRLTAISHDRGVRPKATEQQIAGLLHTLGGLLMFIEGTRR